VIQEARQRIAPGPFSQVTRDARDVRGHAAVEGFPGLALAVAIQDAPEDKKLAGYLLWGEAQTFSLACEVVSKRRGIVISSQCGDERRKAAQLSQPAKPLEGRRHAFVEGPLHALHCKVPRRCSHDPGHSGSEY
jgi:hypothetical protein